MYPHDFKDTEASWMSDMIYQRSEKRLVVSN
jgi:hypothetical protein